LRRRNLAYKSCNAHIAITVRIFRVETIDAAQDCVLWPKRNLYEKGVNQIGRGDRSMELYCLGFVFARWCFAVFPSHNRLFEQPK
jgi:hypothetical protein